MILVAVNHRSSFLLDLFSYTLQLTEILPISGLVDGIQELLCLLPTDPSLSSPRWLLRQPSFTACTLKHYWILLLLRQRVSTNQNLVLGRLLLGRKLKACGALCAKSWRNGESEFLGKYIGCSFFLVLGCSREEKTKSLPASGPMFSPLRHSWRISWLTVESAKIFIKSELFRC